MFKKPAVSILISEKVDLTTATIELLVYKLSVFHNGVRGSAASWVYEIIKYDDSFADLVSIIETQVNDWLLC